MVGVRHVCQQVFIGSRLKRELTLLNILRMIERGYRRIRLACTKRATTHEAKQNVGTAVFEHVGSLIYFHSYQTTHIDMNQTNHAYRLNQGVFDVDN